MSTNGTKRADVERAADDVRRELSDRLAVFHVSIDTGRLEQTEFGGWLLPAHADASVALVKSYELHRLLQDFQERVEAASGEIVSVLLER